MGSGGSLNSLNFLHFLDVVYHMALEPLFTSLTIPKAGTTTQESGVGAKDRAKAKPFSEATRVTRELT